MPLCAVNKAISHTYSHMACGFGREEAELLEHHSAAFKSVATAAATTKQHKDESDAIDDGISD